MRGKESKTRSVRFPASPRVFVLGCTLLVVSVQFLLSRRAHNQQQQQQLQSSRRVEAVSVAPRQGCPAMRPQFVLFGDSITQHGFSDGGWCARLANDYSRKVRSSCCACLSASWSLLHIVRHDCPVSCDDSCAASDPAAGTGGRSAAGVQRLQQRLGAAPPAQTLSGGHAAAGPRHRILWRK